MEQRTIERQQEAVEMAEKFITDMTEKVSRAEEAVKMATKSREVVELMYM